MLVTERREEIANILVEKRKVKVGQLATRFNVSTETIRKDLLELEAQGIIKKNKGSAEVLGETSAHRYTEKSKKSIPLKITIAKKAATLIPKNSVVFFDAGSTIYQLARQLILRKDITVITNFTPIAELMNANGIEVILIGGTIQKVSGAATGLIARSCIQQVYADIAFVGASGFKDADGPCVEGLPEAEIKKDMIAHAQKAYVLADSTKANVRALVQYAKWEDLTALIVDNELSKEQKRLLNKQIKVLESTLL